MRIMESRLHLMHGEDQRGHIHACMLHSDAGVRSIPQGTTLAPPLSMRVHVPSPPSSPSSPS